MSTFVSRSGDDPAAKKYMNAYQALWMAVKAGDGAMVALRSPDDETQDQDPARAADARDDDRRDDGVRLMTRAEQHYDVGSTRTNVS